MNEQNQAITVANPTAGQPIIVSVDAEAVEKARTAVAFLDELAEHAIAIDDAEGYAKATAAYKRAKALAAAIEKDRKAIKAPILDLGRAIDAAAREVVDPLAESIKRVGERIAECDNARKAEADRIKREAEAAEAKARAEREAAERAAAEARAAGDAEAAAKAKADAAAARAAAAEARTAKASAPEVKGSAVRTVRRAELVIDDRSKIPLRSAVGRELWTLDEKAVIESIEGGIAVAGCRVVYTEHVGGTGR